MLNQVVITASENSYELNDVDLVFGTLSDMLGNALICEALTIDTLTFKASPERYSETPSGIDYLDYVPYTDTAEVYHGSELAGKYYIKSVTKISKNYYEYECVSLMGVLENATHNGGIYTGSTAGSIIAELMGDLGYSIDSQLASTILYGWLPISSKRENLRQVLFACGGSVLKDANGDVEFTFNLPATATNFPYNKVYQGLAKVQIAPATEILLTEHTFYASQLTADEIIFDNTAGIMAEHYKVVFDKPYHTLIADGLTIESSGANWAVISGTGTLSGKPYVHIQRILSKSTGITSEKNEIEIKDATLVGNLNSANVLNRIADYCSQTSEISASIVSEQEKPGSLVMLADRNLGTVKGYIKTMKRTMSKIIKSDVTLTQDWIPAHVGNAFNAYKIITDDDLVNGVWTVPADMRGKKALLVLFGGSQGGEGGHAGDWGEFSEKGGSTGIYIGDDGNEEAVYAGQQTPASQGGAGGEGGRGGSLGNVLQVNIASLADSYSVVFGAGGEGGAGGTFTRTYKLRYPERSITPPQMGEYGTDTVFGEWTTADGYSIEGAEFVNIVTGENVAGNGAKGVNGGKGGAGGMSIPYRKEIEGETYDHSIPGKGHDGEPVGNYTGGVGNARAYDYTRRQLHIGGSGPRVWVDCAIQGGAGGGGAADGANGQNGKTSGTVQHVIGWTGSGEHWDTIYTNAYDSTYETPRPSGTIGGNGANAVTIPAKGIRRGGKGGAGGGGGGGYPSYFGNHFENVYEGEGFNYGIGYGGDGGNGSKGGDGADGFAIAYYKEDEE